MAYLLDADTEDNEIDESLNRLPGVLVGGLADGTMIKEKNGLCCVRLRFEH